MATEQEAVPAILDLMTGRWRSQVLHAGVALGIYDALSASLKPNVLAFRVEVEQWRATLSDHERLTWAAPTTVLRHCRVCP